RGKDQVDGAADADGAAPPDPRRGDAPGDRPPGGSVRAGARAAPVVPLTLLRLVAEVCAGDPLLQVLEGAEVLDDVAAGVVEEDPAVLVAADRHQPLEVVAVLEEVVDGLADPPARDDRDLGSGGLLALLRHCTAVLPGARERALAPTPARTIGAHF